MKKSLIVALPGRYFNWGGGIEFLRYIANGLLTKQKTHGLKIYLILPIENKIETPIDALRVAKRSIVGTWQRKRPWFANTRPAFNESMLDFFYNTNGKVDIVYHENSNAGLLRCLKKIKADVVLPVGGTLGADFSIPWAGYVPDFQHKYFPENFSIEECKSRDIHFNTLYKNAKVVIVNSKAVKEDSFIFYPNSKAKIINLPFSPNPVAAWFDELPYDVVDKYDIPKDFFLISNQFWIHKDHLTAFKALKSVDAHMVCTGKLGDYRRPEYGAEIKTFLNHNGLNDRIKILGHIPKREQIEIMKKAIAVVQPTLFEGGPGGGSVYDAISLGVPVILSDIPVNREVHADNVWFFTAGDSDDLARKMAHLSVTEIARPNKNHLVKMGQINLGKLGDTIIHSINLTIERA